jgi:signal transduction histidine kinase
VAVDAADLPQLSAAVEVAAYRIVSEALANTARHAQARRASVRRAGEPPGLLVEVRDDGVGIGPDVVAGVGLRSIRERAEELGGRAEVRCPGSGGTLVRAWLPSLPPPPVLDPDPADPAARPTTQTTAQPTAPPTAQPTRPLMEEPA